MDLQWTLKAIEVPMHTSLREPVRQPVRGKLVLILDIASTSARTIISSLRSRSPLRCSGTAALIVEGGW